MHRRRSGPAASLALGRTPPAAGWRQPAAAPPVAPATDHPYACGWRCPDWSDWRRGHRAQVSTSPAPLGRTSMCVTPLSPPGVAEHYVSDLRAVCWRRASHVSSRAWCHLVASRGATWLRSRGATGSASRGFASAWCRCAAACCCLVGCAGAGPHSSCWPLMTFQKGHVTGAGRCRGSVDGFGSGFTRCAVVFMRPRRLGWWRRNLSLWERSTRQRRVRAGISANEPGEHLIRQSAGITSRTCWRN
jgi:hypothetical protein